MMRQKKVANQKGIMKEIARLDQSTVFKGKRLFVLQDDGTLKVSSSYAGKRQEFSVNIGHLNPEPSRDSSSARQMIVGMCIFAFIAILFAIPTVLPHTALSARLGLLAVSGLFGLGALLCWREYMRQSYDIYAFQDVFTGQSIFFLANLPTESLFTEFVDTLRTEIHSKRERGVTARLSLVDQIKELGRLKAEGLLNEEEFVKAKNNLIESSRPPAAIGFRT